MVEHIVYLHGFNSSPASYKAQKFMHIMARDYAHVRVHVPHLSTWPQEAMADIVALVENLTGKVAFVGSSLGGFYATWLAQKFTTKAVLINPAVRPDLLLADKLGTNSNYHTDDGEYEFTIKHLEQLKSLVVDPLIRADDFLVLLQTADATLDYQDAVKFYADSQLDITQGGSHAYDNFPQRIPQIMSFLG